ncbi:MAG: tetratricopeptide repeat protein [Gammaproteobacteria bacterium]|nr:tetratricopeptide repeat protein [Gammaproteobacteria bacterium]
MNIHSFSSPGQRLDPRCAMIFMLFLMTALLSVSSYGANYVGASRCASCHQQQTKEWQQSDHFHAMQSANATTVLGDFSNATIKLHGYASRFFIDKEQYFVETMNESGSKQVFPVLYTFGYHPLQQYLVDIGHGKLQAFDIAWDTRSEAEGGQRWFHLQPDEKITTEHPFFWTRHFQNWNSRCAQCHSTNLQKNYSAKTNSYNTQWSDANVSCEACHGPGSKHVDLAKAKKLSQKVTGFSHQAQQPLSWEFKKGEAIASPQGIKNSDHTNMCGSCHSLRTQLVEKTTGENFHDSSRLQLLNKGSYFDDGQIREEVFVMGSFLQSKMHSKGVTCNNCHNPHSGKVLIQDNGLCSQCHDPGVYNANKHHHHAVNSKGAACVNCHMPNRTYMQVDERRDHSFTIPRPDLSLTLDVPNVCTQCHKGEQGKDNAWAGKQLSEWDAKPDDEHWAHLNYRAQAGDLLVTRPLTTAVEQNVLPALIRASLLDQLSIMPSRVSVETAQKSLHDSSPLVRRAAVNALEALPIETRWQLLSPYLKDESRSVRFEIAESVASILNRLPPDQQTDLAEIIKEYRQSLSVSSDAPSTQVTIANLELQLGNTGAAEQAYLQALRIEPGYVQGLINLADFYRQTGREPEAEPLHKKALRIAPDDGAVHHSYGLFLIRRQKYDVALPYLKAASEQANAQPRYAYVYAIALDSKNRTNAAIKVLEKANERWPNQYDLLMTLVLYLEKAGDKQSIYKYLSALTAIAPNAPDVKQLVKKYSR